MTGALALVTMLGLLPACTLTTPPTQACRQDWDTLVTWTGRESATEIQFYRGSTLQGRLPITVQGAEVHRSQVLRGDVAYFVGLGNTVYDKTHIVAVNLDTCTVGLTRISQQSILQHELDGNQLFTTSGLNDVGHLHVNDLTTGAQLGDIATPQRESMGITADERHVYAFNADMDEPGLKLMIIDRTSWRVTKTVQVSDLHLSVDDAVLAAGRIYFAASQTGETEGSLDYLGVVDLTTLRMTKLKLPHRQPYQIEVDQKHRRLYVAHTFLNDAFDSYSSYRYVTRIDLDGLAMSTIDTGPNLKQISLSGDGTRLLATHADYETDTANFTITTLDRAEPAVQVDIAAPDAKDYYLAGATGR